MEKKKYINSPEYFVVIMYVAVILLLTSIGLLYSGIKHYTIHDLDYIIVGIIGLTWGIIGLFEFITKKRILPHRIIHLKREILALFVLALTVWGLIDYTYQHNVMNVRDVMSIIILFTIGLHALHLRGYIKEEEEKKE
jgi:hypothetical protein